MCAQHVSNIIIPCLLFLETRSATLTLKVVCEVLAPIVHKWFKIGVQLGIPYEKLMQFKSERDPLAALVTFWLRGNVESVSVCWRSIVEALKSKHVGESGLANKISMNYCEQQMKWDDKGKNIGHSIYIGVETA